MKGQVRDQQAFIDTSQAFVLLESRCIVPSNPKEGNYRKTDRLHTAYSTSNIHTSRLVNNIQVVPRISYLKFH